MDDCEVLYSTTPGRRDDKLDEDVLEKPKPQKRARRSKGGGGAVEEKVVGNVEGCGDGEKQGGPVSAPSSEREEQLHAFLDSDFFREGRWKTSGNLESAPTPSPRTRAKPRTKPRSQKRVESEGESEGRVYNEPPDIYSSLVIV
jgi:hypothetical protein